ncbi:hypothetical protein STSP2_00242 [Anaerohalosphaera lusitana]|uniref:3-keto-alpha-glucoside-1,2-lyase/3-keto-2-hydroxy-glucal hydratase domain-containing protein n=1 Tax=Anaerohalosphaera lusitana TaxID=1936003 RepID=A0A1U9NGN7_9BACT|nr:DUF1080 domain-containing protein [Anaerohalosphaera lusitana]AQT67102.1 hypothetical protein STSP2_00242 [Anaerohalosphaera lusitana]
MRWCFRSVLMVLFVVAGCTGLTLTQSKWKVHDPDRPLPDTVKPASCSTQESAGEAPGDAIILFDGENLSKWSSVKGGGPAKWTVKDGYMQVKPGAGDIITKDKFGDYQLHLEWASPENDKNGGQGKGNSGVFLANNYEIQILDCYNNPTYADGTAGAVYGQSPPAVNVCRKPGQWQTYDIVFHAPEFEDGKVTQPATVTVFHNGVLIQDHWVIKGMTLWKKRPYYKPHAEKMPIRLQDHSDQVKYRNIWLRPLD